MAPSTTEQVDLRAASRAVSCGSRPRGIDLAALITSLASARAERPSRWSHASACVVRHSYTSRETHYFRHERALASPSRHADAPDLCDRRCCRPDGSQGYRSAAMRAQSLLAPVTQRDAAAGPQPASQTACRWCASLRQPSTRSSAHRRRARGAPRRGRGSPQRSYCG